MLKKYDIRAENKKTKKLSGWKELTKLQTCGILKEHSVLYYILNAQNIWFKAQHENF